MEFSEQQIERYSRHIILKEVGVEGQLKLLDSKVLIVGTGGLGAPAAMFLAAAGVGTIGLADGDKVELSNLQRQIIHNTETIGLPKVESGKRTINAMNPDIKVETYELMLEADNIRDIVKNYDFIIDGTDNFPAKFLINDACVLEKKAFSHAGIIRFTGQTMTYIPEDNNACYRCVFKNPPPEGMVPTCSQAGVLGVMGGVIGTIQATEAIKYLLGLGTTLSGFLLTYDSLKMEFRKIKLGHNSNCVVCNGDQSVYELLDYAQAACDLKNDKVNV